MQDDSATLPDPDMPPDTMPDPVLDPPADMPATPTPSLAPFDIDGVHIFPHPTDPATLYYIPAAPVPELTAAGNPTLGLTKMPQMGMLQLGAHFALPPDGEAALLAKIAAANPSLANVRLQPAPLRVLKAAVLLSDETGATSELGSSKTSAFPPFAAVFSFQLTPTQTGRAILGVTGEQGNLFVEYTIQPGDSDTPVTKRCDVAGWFPANDGQSHIRAVG